jgi:uncharacterized protein YndB with AHSA1/START domain
MFTVNEKLESWLTEEADVEPRVDGKYELFWNPEDKRYDSTIGCKITAIEQDKFLSFEWKGPKQYNDFMNSADPLTHVVVFFIPGDGFTEVQLIHSGWRSSPEWAQARQWFEQAWNVTLEALKKQINVES